MTGLEEIVLFSVNSLLFMLSIFIGTRMERSRCVTRFKCMDDIGLSPKQWSAIRAMINDETVIKDTMLDQEVGK